MTNRNAPESDAPRNLKTVSDAERADAIAFAIADAAGWKLHVDVVGSSYRGYLGRRGPFRKPAHLTFEIRAIDEEASPDAIVAALRRVSDEELAASIARRLGDVAGEDYAADIQDRRYNTGKVKKFVARVSMVVALKEPKGSR